ncbi:MAG: DUF6316 family protein [Kangiellaceae bacterium]|nr:DUF6316 family protein [Kangiellaceae bacterium]MCW8998820.1 DUF6316 family protein [Kangiellaceae bacterium]MCW9017926.1 DUF6316 family protein [Kangiellaceae bacterium]
MSLEQSKNPQPDRIFHKKNGWYFATREGLDMGPFPSRRSAEHEISFYLRSMIKLSKAS